MPKRDQQVLTCKRQRKELHQQLVTKTRQSRYMRAEANSDELGSMGDADIVEDGAFFVRFSDMTLEVLSGEEIDDVCGGSDNELREYIKSPYEFGILKGFFS